jgi:trans-aconitate 2-methyltransferase
MTPWNPETYLRFADDRTRPSVDLAARIAVESPHTVIDLGCGPGNSTRVLRERWPSARVSGLDDSAEMIASARDACAEGVWLVADIREWSAAAPYDVVFSNAALQWLPGHESLVAHLLRQVAGGGALAFQVPSRGYSAVARLMDDVASDPEWADQTAVARSALSLEDPEFYYDTLAPLSASVDMWETTYYHVKNGPADIVEWIASTGLRPFLEALTSDAQRARFVQRFSTLVADAYPTRADGRVLFPFKRTFVIAYA